MTDDRPVIIGMNNPYGSDEFYALYPLPKRATGHRIWEMLSAELPDVSMSDYADGFDRRNLLAGDWNDKSARNVAQAMRETLKGRTVVLLGAKVRDAFKMLPKLPCGSDNRLDMTDMEFTYFHWVPHPSGLNQWYNNPANRKAVGELLARLYLGERGQLTIRWSELA